jgi:hypothetical protein
VFYCVHTAAIPEPPIRQEYTKGELSSVLRTAPDGL